MAKKNTAQAPLTPAVLHILLALSTGERHGYGIMKQVQADSQGKAKMGPGTLYGSMGRMMEAGLIRESDKRVDPEMDDERRIYYKLTGAGRGRSGSRCGSSSRRRWESLGRTQLICRNWERRCCVWRWGRWLC